jgi:Tat protein secretion system quality control protein TatD with DNase activity
MHLIDIGANLTHESFRHDFDAVLERAREHGVERMVVTGASRSGSEHALALARAHAGGRAEQFEAAIQALEEHARHEGAMRQAIGVYHALRVDAFHGSPRFASTAFERNKAC